MKISTDRERSCILELASLLIYHGQWRQEEITTPTSNETITLNFLAPKSNNLKVTIFNHDAKYYMEPHPAKIKKNAVRV